MARRREQAPVCGGARGLVLVSPASLAAAGCISFLGQGLIPQEWHLMLWTNALYENRNIDKSRWMPSSDGPALPTEEPLTVLACGECHEFLQGSHLLGQDSVSLGGEERQDCSLMQPSTGTSVD
eukprot:gene2545-biopygen6790